MSLLNPDKITTATFLTTRSGLSWGMVALAVQRGQASDDEIQAAILLLVDMALGFYSSQEVR